ncbi:MAG: hypothetical protein DCF25_08865 [Leptolyngbya foveolarum]|uniref:Uncharacterized protein n=1 Tax=Leptolyngbya foveolarum TaxID=47253 RepID=A0A2W4W9Q8_9CYAN|nr:MAG: hypothetical protein DCF25_08865 [Leptolyngbya foveolarum]
MIYRQAAELGVPIILDLCDVALSDRPNMIPLDKLEDGLTQIIRIREALGAAPQVNLSSGYTT